MEDSKSCEKEKEILISDDEDTESNVCKRKRKDIVLGIDLGTTNSCVAVFHNGNSEVIANCDGDRTTPSVVTYNENQKLVGKAAKDEMMINPINTVYEIKRLIGRRFNEKCVKDDLKRWQFHVVDVDNKPFIKIITKHETKLVNPAEVSSEILKYMKKIAEEYLGQTVSSAVITVPAYFNDFQRKETKDAGRLADFEEIIILNEPTAAAIAFGIKSNNDQNCRNMLVFDLGGGTFDVSILIYKNKDYMVKSIRGDNHLGGQDFTNSLIDYCVDYLNNKGVDIADNAYIMGLLRDECEKTKCSLSTRESRIIVLPVAGNKISIKITRNEFEELCIAHFEKIMETIVKCIIDAELTKDDVDDVILVGGSSRIPKIQTLLENYFGKKTKKMVNADESVAIGAAIKGAIISSEPEVNDIQLVDIIPLSLGVKLKYGVMDPIIERNSKLPVSKCKSFTARPLQDTYNLNIDIYQGERLLTEDNIYLGKLILSNIPYDVKVKPCIEVKMTVSRDGTCKISARDVHTDIENEITLKDVSVTPDNVQVLVTQAEYSKNEDLAKRDEIFARQRLENLCYSSLGKLECDTKGTNDELKSYLLSTIKLIPDLPSCELKNKFEEVESKLNIHNT